MGQVLANRVLGEDMDPELVTGQPGRGRGGGGRVDPDWCFTSLQMKDPRLQRRTLRPQIQRRILVPQTQRRLLISQSQRKNMVPQSQRKNLINSP